MTVSQGVRKFQRKTEDGRKWVTVCTVPSEQGSENLRHHYGSVLGRKEGKDFRFTVHKR